MMRRFPPIVVLLVALAFPVASSALTIHGTFTGGAPSAFQVGGGSIDEVFFVAAGLWERSIGDDLAVDIGYGWDPIGGGSLSRTAGNQIFLDNDSVAWFVDPTPGEDEEWALFRVFERTLGGGSPMVTGRVFGTPAGLAQGRFDLLTVLLHEIGHALGLDASMLPATIETADGDVDVTMPLPHAGAAIPVATLLGIHLDLSEGAALHESFRTGERRLLSEADILAVAQVNGWTDVTTAPTRVPEPRAGALGLVALLGLAMAYRLRCEGTRAARVRYARPDLAGRGRGRRRAMRR